MEQSNIRLNKFLSASGVCSRREADRLIEEGKVQVNGQTAQVGAKVSPEDEVLVGGHRVSQETERIILACYKPKGIVCTFEKREKNNIIDFLHYPKRITYAGRLDKESEGLLIMTNQGELIQEMMRAKNEHEKEYIVTVNRPVTLAFMHKLQNGIWLEELGVQTRKCEAEIVGERTFRIVLTQGLNRQIRRMCEACGYYVRKLVRVRIMNIELGDLERGAYRNLTQEEIRKLYKRLNLNPIRKQNQ